MFILGGFIGKLGWMGMDFGVCKAEWQNRKKCWQNRKNLPEKAFFVWLFVEKFASLSPIVANYSPIVTNYY